MPVTKRTSTVLEVVGGNSGGGSDPYGDLIFRSSTPNPLTAGGSYVGNLYLINQPGDLPGQMHALPLGAVVRVTSYPAGISVVHSTQGQVSISIPANALNGSYQIDFEVDLP